MLQIHSMSRKRRPIAGGVIALATVVALSACSSSSSTSSATPTASNAAKGATIGFVPPVSIPAFVDMFNAMKTQAAALGMKVVQAGGGGFDQAAQIQALNSLIDRKVQVIVTPPLNPAAVQPVLERAEAAGIKWIDYDSDIKNPTVTIQSGEVQSASAVAKALAKVLKSKGKPCKLGIINGAPVVTALVRTAEGFKQGALAAGCTILDTETDTTNEQTGGQSIGNAWKARFGNQMTGILSYVGSVTLGAISTFQPGSFEPTVGSEASSPAYRADIANGSIAVGFDSETSEIGQASVYTAYLLLNGQKVPKSIISPVKIITAQNVHSLPPASISISTALGVSIATVAGTPTFAFKYPAKK